MNFVLKQTAILNGWVNSFFFRSDRYLDVYFEYLRSTLFGQRVVLHLGAGQDRCGIYKLVCSAPDKIKMISLDISSENLMKNPNPNKIVADAMKIPLETSSVDIITCEHLFEHLENPIAVMTECRRVLKPGGKLIFTTPNKWSYIGVLAMILPLSFHIFWKQLIEGPHTADKNEICRTYYRLNSIGRIKSVAAKSGFEVEELRTFAGAPGYSQILPGLHLMFVLIHKFLDIFQVLKPLRISIVGCLIKRTKPCRDRLGGLPFPRRQESRGESIMDSALTAK
jgi:ubiquinone/menaquinone biosynthesis C-methylase UbiE